MISPTTSLLPLLALLCSNGSLAMHDAAGRMALVRPFTTHDVHKLVESFTQWLPPCSGPRTDVDLVLVSSQKVVGNAAAMKAVNDIMNPVPSWRGCFQNVKVYGVGIDPKQDIYIASAQEERADWVSGPNRHFEKTIRYVQGDYETMYLMEGDSVPKKANWLDALMNEVEVQRPFAIIGR